MQEWLQLGDLQIYDCSHPLTEAKLHCSWWAAVSWPQSPLLLLPLVPFISYNLLILNSMIYSVWTRHRTKYRISLFNMPEWMDQHKLQFQMCSLWSEPGIQSWQNSVWYVSLKCSIVLWRKDGSVICWGWSHNKNMHFNAYVNMIF